MLRWGKPPPSPRGLVTLRRYPFTILLFLQKKSKFLFLIFISFSLWGKARMGDKKSGQARDLPLQSGKD